MRLRLFLATCSSVFASSLQLRNKQCAEQIQNLDEDCAEKIQTCNDRLGVLEEELETLKNYSEKQSKYFKRTFVPF